MNEELINSLMWKAGAKFEMMNWVHYDNFDYEKFAELIIQECIKIADDSQYSCRTFPVSTSIKDHFGVK